jgi:hypothetical protein
MNFFPSYSSAIFYFILCEFSSDYDEQLSASDLGPAASARTTGRTCSDEVADPPAVLRRVRLCAQQLLVIATRRRSKPFLEGE